MNTELEKLVLPFGISEGRFLRAGRARAGGAGVAGRRSVLKANAAEINVGG
jgi:hypothetical protein